MFLDKTYEKQVKLIFRKTRELVENKKYSCKAEQVALNNTIAVLCDLLLVNSGINCCVLDDLRDAERYEINGEE